jgi:hypothetical protein
VQALARLWQVTEGAGAVVIPRRRVAARARRAGRMEGPGVSHHWIATRLAEPWEAPGFGAAGKLNKDVRGSAGAASRRA